LLSPTKLEFICSSGLYNPKSIIQLFNNFPVAAQCFLGDAVYEILTYMETMKNPNQLDETKKSVRQIKNTPKDLIHGQLNGKKPLETRETEMSNPVVTGGSGEQSKTLPQISQHSLLSVAFSY
jgi:hypothetical protein